MKLTLISITFRGVRYSKFVWCPLENYGTIPAKFYQDFADEIGVLRGQTFTLT